MHEPIGVDVRDSLFKKLEAFVVGCIRHRLAVVVVYALLTLAMLSAALRVEIKTVFEDLLPRNHPYIQVHEQLKQTFGGSNLVSIMLEVDSGDVFSQPVL